MQELFILCAIGLIFVFWLNQSTARDKVRLTTRMITQQRNLVFLDDSVMMKTITIKPKLGKLAFYRTFSFEFSDAQAERMKGSVVCHAGMVTEIQYFHNDHIETLNTNL